MSGRFCGSDADSMEMQTVEKSVPWVLAADTNEDVSGKL
jgi:hypothetical protein